MRAVAVGGAAAGVRDGHESQTAQAPERSARQIRLREGWRVTNVSLSSSLLSSCRSESCLRPRPRSMLVSYKTLARFQAAAL